jgi:hypothetical protein
MDDQVQKLLDFRLELALLCHDAVQLL